LAKYFLTTAIDYATAIHTGHAFEKIGAM